MSPKFIILVENDINLRQSIALILQRTGYTVTATDSVDKALELIHSGNYHLLISDVNIPETQNTLLPMLHEVYPPLPVVILTDQSSVEADMASKLFKAHYLVKPIAPESLVDSVRSILNQKNNSNHFNTSDVRVNQI